MGIFHKSSNSRSTIPASENWMASGNASSSPEKNTGRLSGSTDSPEAAGFAGLEVLRDAVFSPNRKLSGTEGLIFKAGTGFEPV